jgi:hypothetical protein
MDDERQLQALLSHPNGSMPDFRLPAADRVC